MLRANKEFAVQAVVILALLTAAALAPRAASADDEDMHAAKAGVTFGARAMYDRPKDASEGTLGGGVQLRLHLTSVLAVEGSADARQNNFGGYTIDTFPVQASLLLYLLPGFAVSPYLLGGVGWYFTHVVDSGVSPAQNRYGPHAGGGLEVALSEHWTIDGSYRYLWNQSLNVPTTAHPAGQNFSDNGFMLTAALNYRF